MNLRQRAAQDATTIIEDHVSGFGWPVVVTNPAGVSASFTGYTQDIGQTIDQETGLAVSGREASVALAISSLTACSLLGASLPSAIADKASKPWVITFDDLCGKAQSYKVTGTMPDQTHGILVCLLEAYIP